VTSEQIDALWDISDATSGYDRLAAALKNAPESADEIHTQICRALGLQRKFDEAWAELARISSAPSPIVQVRIDLESGRLKNSSGDKAGAKPSFLKALDEAQKRGFDYYAIDAAHMLAIVTRDAESVEWNENALRMARQSKDPRAQMWQGSLLNNLGWTYHDAGQLEKALTTFQEALTFQEGAGQEEGARGKARLRIAKWAVARCLRSLQRYEEALAIQRELVPFPEQGYVSEEMGELLLVTGRAEEARPYFKRAHELLSRDVWLKANESKRLERLKELSA
jgi:tetratricopeptide (TPR) repeat protein